MTRNILRTIALAVAAVATLAAGTVNAQSYQYEWSEQSSWQSEWSMDSNGNYHESRDEQYSNNSTETIHNGFNTETIQNGYQQQNGYQYGHDQFGTYDNSYNHQNGFNNHSNVYDNGLYRDETHTQNSWEQNQGTNRSWDPYGGYTENGYNDYRDQFNQQQSTGYYDGFGNWVEQGTTYEQRNQDLYDYQESYDRFGGRQFRENGFRDMQENRGGFTRIW